MECALRRYIYVAPTWVLDMHELSSPIEWHSIEATSGLGDYWKAYIAIGKHSDHDEKAHFAENPRIVIIVEDMLGRIRCT